ncbi:amidase [Alkalinema sp. FACHB-956]|uniref:amidase n=1 Tax=Alkalinema sp. FACHB-956 TaxID=2692768 RepID=UPI00168368DB|nr:amidase [Alkalinema sp. FACHB-956]MBD2329361.1 amidase [Alkalinema sp. FACHB-956]
MNPTDLAFTSALEQARLIREKVISPLELTQLYLDRIERLDPQLGAFFHVAAEQALQDAQAKTEQITQCSADLPPFFGVPTGIKDLNSVKDMPCCYGVRLLRNRIAAQDDLVTTKMKQAGFVILGKTSTSQLGALPYVEPPGFAPTRTPWNLAYSAGGSSGGAGAAVAAGLCAVAPGTDGGGSVRIPAACCGLVGLKPSRGRVSCAPVDEYFSGCVVSGTLARSVADAAALLDVLAGYEVGDPYWLPNPNTSFLEATQHDPGKLRIGFATQIPPLGDASADCREAVLKTAHLLESIGHTVEPMEFGAFEFGEMIEPFRLVWQIHSDVGIPGIFLEKVNRDLWFKAQFFRAGKYIQVRQRLYAFARRVVQVCQPYDLVVLPTLMYPDLQVGAWKRLSAQQILQKVIHWIAPCPAFNVSGQPAIALPMGFTPAGIPVSVQLVGRPAAESSLIAVARQLEAIVDWQQQRPTIAL